MSKEKTTNKLIKADAAALKDGKWACLFKTRCVGPTVRLA